MRTQVDEKLWWLLWMGQCNVKREDAHESIGDECE